MTITAPIFVRDLKHGEQVVYDNRTYRIVEIFREVPGLDGSTVVIGRRGDDFHRYPLVYANAGAVVELVT